jgi:tRNA A37 threonylcarbamoyladenosine dehydratase
MFSRLELLVGDKLSLLQSKKVIVFGVGGVGGYATEMLARSGIGSITVVDYDTVDITNKNRQIIALDSTIGKSKVEVMKYRIYDFNKDCYVTAIDKKLTADNIADFDLTQYDYIVDAIYMVTSKINLITFAHNNNIPVISAMGVGNRLGIPEFEITDIYKTSGDGLAKVLRKKLRENGVSNHTVIFCKNQATPNGDTIGSIAYYPAISGCMVAAKVIEDFLKGEN